MQGDPQDRIYSELVYVIKNREAFVLVSKIGANDKVSKEFTCTMHTNVQL